ncbi:helix-turn-helix domain-containing protein [Francisella philomiragia]|uniref:Helix-turn-helix domain-containing protein n=1 Tax=Francisella philomiragia TaxID=28110 RepID=A0ABS1GEK2_9GAMM|nr:helix-turn-helix domain-containing protein [Francisella philomiragia]MBK2259577.1 helix-turn-helix domain-containing protein [Francisella philomiragia]MBK2303269.1 helix-turn-helix domain-containing protein [Francisella philomiragia]
MSLEAVNWSIEQDIDKSSAKLVLIILSNYANDDGVSYPSYSTLMEKTSCSRDTINRSIKYLIEHGYITLVDSDFIPKKYDKKQNCYQINVGKKILLVRKSDQSDSADSGSQILRDKVVRKSDSNIKNKQKDKQKTTTTIDMENIDRESQDEKSESVSCCPFSFDELKDSQVEDIEHERDCLRYSLIQLHLSEEQANTVIANYPLDIVDEAIQATEQANLEKRIDTTPPRYLYGILKNHKRTA